MIEQTLKQRGYSDSDIAKINAVMSNPQAYQHAVLTSDFDAAYAMTLPKEKSETYNLSEWFSSFVEKMPEDAKSLSIAMSKFARWIQSETDKKKPD
ncbi:MAG: hypothetical protein RR282_00735 [Acinetobacter sp.]